MFCCHARGACTNSPGQDEGAIVGTAGLADMPKRYYSKRYHVKAAALPVRYQSRCGACLPPPSVLGLHLPTGGRPGRCSSRRQA